MLEMSTSSGYYLVENKLSLLLVCSSTPVCAILTDISAVSASTVTV